MRAQPRASVATAPPAWPILVPSRLLELVGSPCGSLSPGPACRGSWSPHSPPTPQAQACLLLQKTLPTRELRLCFKDPEWEQLLDQVLAKVTEVTATGLRSPAHWQWCSGNQGARVAGPCAWGCVGGPPKEAFLSSAPQSLRVGNSKALGSSLEGLSLAAFSLDPADAG